MAQARDKALWVRSIHGWRGILTDEQLDAILLERRVDLVEDWPFAGNLSEALVNGVLFLKRGETSAWRRWDKGHALGHVLLHVGNQLGQQTIMSSRWERQANEFAFWLIFGDCRLPCDCDPVTLAEWGRVPVEPVAAFLTLHRDHPRLFCPLRAWRWARQGAFIVLLSAFALQQLGVLPSVISLFGQ